MFSLLPCPNIPKSSVLLCSFRDKGLWVVQGFATHAVQYQQHWHHTHTIMAVAGVHTGEENELMLRAHASAPRINTLDRVKM
jgi:hypothetical protein